MTVSILNNVGKTMDKKNQNRLAPANRIVVIATQAGDVAIVDMMSIYSPSNNYGVTWQLADSSGTLKIELTLAEAEAVRPTVQASVGWHQLVATLANGAMQGGNFLIATFCRLTFTQPGKCFIANV